MEDGTIINEFNFSDIPNEGSYPDIKVQFLIDLCAHLNLRPKVILDEYGNFGNFEFEDISRKSKGDL